MGRARNTYAATAGAKPRKRVSEGESYYEGWSSEAACNRERIAGARGSGEFVPAAEGTERPFRARSGVRLLWCWRPATGEHQYLNCDTDIFIPDEEAQAHLGQPLTVAKRERTPEACALEAACYLPQELIESGHYKALERQHFQKRIARGPAFSDIRSIAQLLELCAQQRGTLNGDDREELILLGADAKAFIEENTRYLKVIADGESGVVNASELNPLAPVKVVRVQEGEPCSLVAEGRSNQPAFVGTIIIVANNQEQASTRECVLSAYPGLPLATATTDIWPEGAVISAGDALAWGHAQGQTDVVLRVEKPKSKIKVQRDLFTYVLGNSRGG
jgi:hypothetical protein